MNGDPYAKNSQPPPGASGYKRQSRAQRGDFIKWTDGQARDVQIMSASATSTLGHWVSGKRVQCTGQSCANCMAGDRASERWSLDVLCEGKTLTWEMANATFALLEDIAEMVGHLYRLWVKVKRSGTGINTRYTIIPLAQPPEEDRAKDAGAQAEYIKKTLEALDKDPKETLAEFLAEAPTHIVNAGSQQQLDAFLEYVDNLEEPIPGMEESDPEPGPTSAASYF